MCSLQTSTGTALTHREEENRMTGAVVDDEDELVLDFCRLAGGAADELEAEVDINFWWNQSVGAGGELSQMSSRRRRCDTWKRQKLITNPYQLCQ